jgi:hypothetical protein
MAHAGLATTLLVLCELLADFLRPLQWALLCSVPLGEMQQAPHRLLGATLPDTRAALLRRPLMHSSAFPRLLR